MSRIPHCLRASGLFDCRDPMPAKQFDFITYVTKQKHCHEIFVYITRKQRLRRLHVHHGSASRNRAKNVSACLCASICTGPVKAMCFCVNFCLVDQLFAKNNQWCNGLHALSSRGRGHISIVLSQSAKPNKKARWVNGRRKKKKKKASAHKFSYV